MRILRDACISGAEKKKVKQHFLDSCRESGWVQNSETGGEQLRAKRYLKVLLTETSEIGTSEKLYQEPVFSWGNKGCIVSR